MRTLTHLTLSAGIVLAMLVAAPRRPEAAPLLDGKSFAAKGMAKGSAKEEADTLVFREGKLRSLACDAYGFNEAPYSAKKNGSRIEFEAVTTSVHGGRISWKGSVDGDQIQGTSVMGTGKGASEISFTGRSQAVDASAAALQASAMKRLAPLVGQWKLSSLSMADGKKLDATGTWSCEDAGMGLGILCKLSVRGMPGVDEYRMSGVFGYDAGGSRYHLYSISNVGETHDHAGAFGDEKTLSLQHKGEMDGKAFVEKLDMTIEANKLVGTSKCTLGGQVIDDSTFVFERVRS